MIKEKYILVRCKLISCIYAGNDKNGNGRYKLIVVSKNINILNKVYSGICKDSNASSYKNDSGNGYYIRDIFISFYITDKNKVVFTEIGE